ncbi:MAG: diguanylate cyclase [Deltaproteobacteria bacterium]|nr:MAG: diguanylate cyclase [Deltaproteobacteria bacterium]
MKQATMGKRILCLHEEDYAYDPIRRILSDKGYFVYDYSDANAALAHIYNEPPDIMLVSTETRGWEEFMIRIKSDSVYKHLPLILLTSEEMLTSLLSLSDLSCDDFFLYPARPEELLLRVRLKETNATSNLDANPLSRLPGNQTIMATIQKTIQQEKTSALCYLDLDNFKVFNDRYGFARGDEAIRMTARVITNVVHRTSNSDSFVGHVGGDDFFFIVPSHITKECCEQIIQNFDLVISTLIDDEDRVRGYIESKDRRGNIQHFPLLSLSIAVIDLNTTTIDHPGKVSSIAGELKKVVKKLKGSNYMINRRTRL